jgi:cardiolipin synthase
MKKVIPIPLLIGLLFASGCSTLTLPKKQVGEPLVANYSVTDPEFGRSISQLLSADLVAGNNVVELLNGDQIFPSMLDAIAHAKISITMEMYFWSSGDIATAFIAALSERARAGVKVHVLIDAWGSAAFRKSDIDALQNAGVELVMYNLPHILRPLAVNHRSHRKVMVVDGRIGFTGGACISDDWAGDAEPGYWRDTNFRVEGPVVAQMQGVFMDNWIQARSSVLHGEDYFPALEPVGIMTAQFFRSGPKDSAENARISYLLAIAAARKSIRLAHAYFVPDSLAIDELVAACQRGVKVEIIVPDKIDNFLVKKASRSRWGKLLDAGADFYEYQPTLYHCKVMIVDDVWVTVGSVNFDERSFHSNDEANLNVSSRDFAKQMIQTFEADKAQSVPLTAKDFKRRNIFSKALEEFLGLFRSWL